MIEVPEILPAITGPVFMLVTLYLFEPAASLVALMSLLSVISFGTIDIDLLWNYSAVIWLLMVAFIFVRNAYKQKG